MLKITLIILSALSVGMPVAATAQAREPDRYADALQWLEKDSVRDYSVQTRTLTGAEISLPLPILEIFEALRRGDLAEVFPVFPDSCAHQASGSDPTLCLEIASPLEAYTKRSAPTINETTMSTVEGVLDAILTVGTKTDWPSAVRKVIWVRRLENLVRKVRFAEWQRRLETALNQAQLDDLARAELFAARTFLSEIARHSPVDSKLPFPLLTKNDRFALSLFLGGVMWRFRGAGGYDDFGTRDRRRLFARAPFEAIARLNGASPSFAHQIGWSIWFGLMQSWGRFHDLGRLNDTLDSDFAEMKNRGEFASRFTSHLAGIYGYSPREMKEAGQHMASCYYYGWEGTDPNLKVGAHLRKPYLFLIGAPSNFGELCTGASLALGLAKTLADQTTDKN
jgi:hypothetical protein